MNTVSPVVKTRVTVFYLGLEDKKDKKDQIYKLYLLSSKNQKDVTGGVQIVKGA